MTLPSAYEPENDPAGPQPRWGFSFKGRPSEQEKAPDGPGL